MLEDTIAAIATPMGEGAIGIVRLSGPKALEIAEKIFWGRGKEKLKEQGSHRLHYGYIVDPESGERVDEVLLSVMLAPRTYTREDVVEINCHGGIVPLRRVLELTLKYGARLAMPGEFTKRAFLNGRIDLAQAESVLDVIRAKTEEGLRVALHQLAGGLSGKVKGFQERILNLLAHIEASIDFPEEDIEELTREEIEGEVREMIREVEQLVRDARYGKVYREGLRTVIVGRPNVGKSSLLNALLRERRAIVTEIPGTTRDVIEEVVNIAGIPVRLADTAGLRATEDVVEKIGVERSREAVELADMVLVVLDASTGLVREDLEILELVKEKRGIVLVNKCDLADGAGMAGRLKGLVEGKPVLLISVKTGWGLKELEETIAGMVLEGRVSASEVPVVSHVRHRVSLEKCREHLKEVQAGLERGENLDLLAIDLRGAWEALGEITGSTLAEEIVDRIFQEFCVGK